MKNTPIDLVVTYVDGTDPVWQESYAKYNTDKTVNRVPEYRIWDNLRYLLRAVDKNMPYVNNVFLVVACESQVPSWLDTDKIKVVYHRDFIPEEYLPTFCSTTIEMFLGFIPGLSENFIYSNDDMFALNPSTSKIFFRGNTPVISHEPKETPYDIKLRYECHLRNSLALAEKAAGIKYPYPQVHPRHNMNPMRASAYREIWDRCGDDLRKIITRFREWRTCNQFLFSFYDYIQGNYAPIPKGTTKFTNFKKYSAEEIAEIIRTSEAKLICINDKGVGDFEKAKALINAALHEKFPDKGRFEKD
jgi:hypothetical protein